LNYRLLSRRLIIKRDMQTRLLDDKELHLALGMPTSEWLTPEGREKEPTQNNKEANPKQLKLSKTYPSIWS
jgi:hypothetical protein